jgi:Coenzyme PQQ synthesis protein D (PqqD)
MISGERVFGRRERVIVQQVEGDSVLLDIDSGEYFTLNEVGGRVWELCDGADTVDAIIETICAEYDADQGTVATDVQALFDALVGAGLVVAR